MRGGGGWRGGWGGEGWRGGVKDQRNPPRIEAAGPRGEREGEAGAAGAGWGEGGGGRAATAGSAGYGGAGRQALDSGIGDLDSEIDGMWTLGSAGYGGAGWQALGRCGEEAGLTGRAAVAAALDHPAAAVCLRSHQ